MVEDWLRQTSTFYGLRDMVTKYGCIILWSLYVYKMPVCMLIFVHQRKTTLVETLCIIKVALPLADTELPTTYLMTY